MRHEGEQLFSRVLSPTTECDQFVIFGSDQGELPEEQQHPVVTVTRRPVYLSFAWTTYLSAMVVLSRATEQLGVLHGVSFSYGQPESAPTATYKTALRRHIPLRPLSRLIAATSAYLGLAPAQIEKHLADFINPQVASNPKG